MALAKAKITNVNEATAIAKEGPHSANLIDRNILIQASASERDLVRAAVRAALQGESLEDFDLFRLATTLDSIQIENCPDLGLPLSTFIHGKFQTEERNTAIPWHSHAQTPQGNKSTRFTSLYAPPVENIDGPPTLVAPNSKFIPFLVDYELAWHKMREDADITDTFREQWRDKIRRLLEIHNNPHPTDADLAERDKIQISIQFHKDDIESRAFNLAGVINATLDSPDVPVIDIQWKPGKIAFVNNRTTSHTRPANPYSKRKYPGAKGTLYSLLV